MGTFFFITSLFFSDCSSEPMPYCTMMQGNGECEHLYLAFDFRGKGLSLLSPKVVLIVGFMSMSKSFLPFIFFNSLS